MIKFLMVSGGIDSATMVDEILKEKTDDDIVELHHVRMKYDLYPRNYIDYKAFRKEVEYFRKQYGEIKFSVSEFKMNPSVYKIGDVSLVAFHGALKLRDLISEFFQIRNEYLDAKLYIAFEAYTNESLKTIRDTSRLRRRQAQTLVNAVFNDYPDRGLKIPEIVWYFIDKTKAYTIHNLPGDLKNVVNSCRYPFEIEGEIFTCGVCESCFVNKNAEESINDS